MKNLKKSYIELFLNKLLKSGKKYKYFLLIRNLTILFDKSHSYIPFNKKKIWKPDIINKSELLKKTHGYTFVKKIIRKKKKFKKIISVTKLNMRQDILKESFKLINLIIYKLPIRTLSLKLYYLILILNNKKLKKLKIFKKLTSLYYNNIKQTKKLRKKKNKKKFRWTNNEYNLNKRFFLKYKYYYDIINSKNKWVFLKEKIKKKNSWRTRKKNYRFRKTLKKRFKKKIQVKYLFRDKHIIRVLNKKISKLRSYNDDYIFKNKNNIVTFYNNQEIFFFNIIYKFNDIIKNKKFNFSSEIIHNSFKNRNDLYCKDMLLFYLRLRPFEYYFYRSFGLNYNFTNRILHFGKRVKKYKNFLKTFSNKDYQKVKLNILYYWNIKNSLFYINKIRSIKHKYRFSYIIHNKRLYAIITIDNKNKFLRINQKKIINKNNLRIWRKYKLISRKKILSKRWKFLYNTLVKLILKKNSESNIKYLYTINKFRPRLIFKKNKIIKKKSINFRLKLFNNIIKKKKFLYNLNIKNYNILKKKFKKYIILLEKRIIAKERHVERRNKRIIKKNLKRKKKNKEKEYNYKDYLTDILTNIHDDDHLIDLFNNLRLNQKKIKKILKIKRKLIVINMQLVYSNFVYIINNILWVNIFVLSIYLFIIYYLMYYILLCHIIANIINIYIKIYLFIIIFLKFTNKIQFIDLFKIKIKFSENLLYFFKIYPIFSIINRFIFYKKKFSTWNVTKFITKIFLEKLIFFKFSNKKNVFNNIYKKNKIKHSANKLDF